MPNAKIPLDYQRYPARQHQHRTPRDNAKLSIIYSSTAIIVIGFVSFWAILSGAANAGRGGIDAALAAASALFALFTLPLFLLAAVAAWEARIDGISSRRMMRSAWTLLGVQLAMYVLVSLYLLAR